MSAEENKCLAREGIRILSSGDLRTVDQIYTPTTSTTSTTTPTILGICTASRR
jgi:hypothetical protein